MLPSKGYFKSLNCPYFQNGFCDRPHCHFRHTRKDKAADDYQLLEDVDQSTQIADILSDVAGETSSDCLWPASQSSPSTSVSYKPTPIVELKKRHIPITTAPIVTLSSNSQKRRIEYDVKGIKKPKVEYIPEAVNSESNSGSVYPTNVTSAVYKATKICDHPDRLLNGANAGGNALIQDNEESEGEIDFDQVSNELNFLDEILKEYENPISIKSLLNESNFNEDSAQKKEEREQIKNNSEVLSAKASNGFLKHCQTPPGESNRRCSSESDHINSNEIKKHKDCDHKVKSSHNDSKNRTVNNCSNIAEKSRQKGSTSSSTSGTKDESKSGSEHRRKSVDHHKSEKNRNKNKGGSETLSCSSKSTKRELGSESSFDKLLKSDSNKSSNSVKQSKKEHGSSSNKSSNKESDHKSSSSKSTRKDSERESSSNKSSIKESDRKSNSSKSYKKESDHQSKSSKSSKSEHHESSRKRTHSPESHSNSKKHKDNSKAEHKQDDSRQISKYKDENRHRKESNDKRSTKEDKSLNSKEYKRRGTSNTGNREKRKRTHSVSESEVSSDDDVEIISEHESIIVIDSEEDTNSENSPSNSKSKVENVESSPSPAHSSGMASPTFPSDESDTSDVEYSAQDDQAAGQISNGPSRNTKTQDDASLLDHRVQSRIKNRVSLGSVWRPPAMKKNQVEIMTPAQRLLLFAKLREKEEKDDSQSNAGRVKIGCVPNVKHLLEEKKRLLKGSNQNVHPKDTRRPNAITMRHQVVIQPNQVEDKDEAPTAPLETNHPTKKGANIYLRREMLEKLYKVQKQLLEPNRLFKDAKEKCRHDESKIWLATPHDTYEKEMENLIKRRKSEIPDFTLRFFTSIRPKQSIMFPRELMKKPENGRDQTSPSSEESLYSWFLKYCLTEEQLEAEGYPRKKIDSSRGRIVAYINQDSLNKWKKAQGIPPTGEYTCSNCSKFYSVDDDGLSTGHWECRYHAKKALRTLKDKSGLFEKKARCCGNGLDNPCMTSEYHSTETRDMQNLEGFVETKDPQGEMPLEGWGIFALDCEMYWSTRGLELGRVTVVNADQRTVYDTFVKPELPVTDYSTRMSGLTKENLGSARKTFAEVQTDLMKLFNSKTILIGHSLENDLKVLQIIHNVVVDTAMVFKNGDKKQALKMLASDLLKEAIQNEEHGHDSAEDAVTCIRLMMHKIFKDAAALAKRAPPAPRGRYRANNPWSL